MNNISISELITTSLVSVLLESCIKDIGSLLSFLF